MGDVFDSRTAGSSTSLDLDTLVLFQAGVELVFETLFAPSRVERLAQQATFYSDNNRSSLPTLFEVLSYTFEQLFQPALTVDELAEPPIAQALVICQATFYNTLLRLERVHRPRLSMAALSTIHNFLKRFKELMYLTKWCVHSALNGGQCGYLMTQAAAGEFIGTGDTIRLPNGPPI